MPIPMSDMQQMAKSAYPGNTRRDIGGFKLFRSTPTLKFYYTTTGIIFTASGSSLVNVRYAVIRNSTGAGNGVPICYVALSTAQFTITSPNTLTILPPANGVFSLN